MSSSREKKIRFLSWIWRHFCSTLFTLVRHLPARTSTSTQNTKTISQLNNVLPWKKPSLKVFFSIVLLLSLSAFLSSIYSTCFSLANYTNYVLCNKQLHSCYVSNSKPYPNDFLQIIAMPRWEKYFLIKVPKNLRLQGVPLPFHLFQTLISWRVFDLGQQFV